MQGIIYKITNLINNKIYIGQTVRSLEKRWQEHQREAFCNQNQRPLYKAFRKYGIENFNIEIVEYVDIEILMQTEMEYIAKYNCLAILNNGYNATRGGEGIHTADYDLIRALWDKGYCVTEIIQMSKTGRTGVRAALKNYPSYNNEESRRRGIIYYSNNYRENSPIYQYSISGEFIAEYVSAYKAAEYLNKKVKTIQVALETPGSTAYGYQWSYEKYEKISPIKHTPKIYNHAILEISTTGEIITEFKNSKDAEIKTGINAATIRYWCKNYGKIKSRSNRYFKYKD